MGTQSRNKVTMLLWIIVAFAFFLSSIHFVFAENLLVYGTNFPLYFEVNQSLMFQHIGKLFAVNPFSLILTVDSGLLNATGSTLRMYESSGVLTFTNNNVTTLSFVKSIESMKLWINTQEYGSPVALGIGETVRIEWSMTGWNPVLAILGIIGLALFIVTPTYTIYQVKVKKEYLWIVYGICLLALAYGFVYSWVS